MEKYIEGEEITSTDIIETMKFRTKRGRLYPAYRGSALKDVGIEELMKGILMWFPIQKESEKQEEVAAFVYKVELDEKGRKMAYVKCHKGSLEIRKKINVCGKGEAVTMKSLFGLKNGKLVQVDRIEAHDKGKHCSKGKSAE